MKHLIILIILILPCLVFAQSAERTAIASGGTETIVNASMRVSQTIGEPMVGSFSNASMVVSEGFQQGSSNSVNTPELNPEEISIVAFPNPVSGMLSLQIESTRPMDLNLSMVDVSGKAIDLQEKQLAVFNRLEREIDFSHLAAGLYFLQLIDAKSGSHKTLRIEKIH